MVQKTQIIKNDKQQNKTKQNKITIKKDNTKTTFTNNIAKHPSPTKNKRKTKRSNK